MERCQLLESLWCEHVLVFSEDHRIEPGHGHDDENEDADVEPDVLWLVLLEPVVVAEEV